MSGAAARPPQGMDAQGRRRPGCRQPPQGMDAQGRRRQGLPPPRARGALGLPPRAANGFPTVGLLLADLHTGSSRSLWPAVADEARRRGMNLVCFAGGRLTDADHTASGRVYDLACPDCLDGAVSWVSSLGGGAEPAEVERFHERFRGMPLVCLSQQVLGAPTVLLDAYHGMRAVVAHLLVVHGYRRVAFVRGPASHPSAGDRLRAYRDELAAHGIAADEALVSPPLAWDSGAEAVGIFLDDRGLHPGAGLEAIVAASDLLALEALRAVQSRGFRVPADLAITGFNDTAESRLATPPFTTARMPFGEQGAAALGILAGLMGGTPAPPSHTLPTQLVIRQSCGCTSAAVALAGSAAGPARGDSPAAELAQSFAPVRAACLADMQAFAGLGHEAADAWLEPLVDAFLADGGTAAPRRFIATLEDVLDRSIRAGVEVAPWQNAVSVLRRDILGLLASADQPAAESLFAQARILVSEAAGRERTLGQWRADRLATALRDLGTDLLAAFDVSRLADAMDLRLPRLGIETFFLCTCDEPACGEARLVLARTERGRAALPAGGLPFPSRRLVPPDLLPRNRRYDLAVMPLQFRGRWLGYAVLEIGPRDGAVYDTLRGALSTALNGVSLLREAHDARRAAEKADLIKTRLLANVSHELRTPLDLILRRARPLREGVRSGAMPDGGELEEGLRAIETNAEHQLRLIGDLLDLSRAEIDELDLDLAMVDPRPVLVEAFQAFVTAEGTPPPGGVSWKLDLPERLPTVRADPVRLRQILLNLLANARTWTVEGSVTLSADVDPPHLHVRVADTGPGVPPALQQRIFEPFSTSESTGHGTGGIGLGLPISRHLAVLHGGSLTVDSAPGRGAVFHLRLPLPDLAGDAVPVDIASTPSLLLVTRAVEPPSEIAELARRRGFEIRRLDPGSDWQAALSEATPAALAWDLANAAPGDRSVVLRLARHPRLSQAPVILYGGTAAAGGVPRDALAAGITGFVAKTAPARTLWELVEAVGPAAGPILVVDDDPEVRRAHAALAADGLPGVVVRTAADGEEALAAMAAETPGLVLLDIVMPRMDGFALLERMRATPSLRRVPVVVLTNKVLDADDVRRLEGHGRVTLQTKGVWSDEETIAALNRVLFGTEHLPPETGALVKRAVAWLARNHAAPVARWQLAEAVGASEDYLARVFHRDLGISPWDYLNRYRVHRAGQMLRGTDESVKAIAARVGFKDPAYFSRIFTRVTGHSPREIRGAG
jgi:signal transduction histidine kinase/DNA-binding LacI/PurR family transcriptional regulator/CheY-like chemotaxis protein/AraC-like DNA-binding protein